MTSCHARMDDALRHEIYQSVILNSTVHEPDIRKLESFTMTGHG